MVMDSYSKLLGIQPQKYSRQCRGYGKHSQILDFSQPTVSHQAPLLVLRVRTHSTELPAASHLSSQGFLEKVFTSIAVDS